MAYIENLIADVEKTHSNFGKLIAMCQIVVKAHKFLLIVSPSGCGKSRAMEFIYKNTKESYQPTQISIAGMANKADKLCSFRSVILIDDIASIQTSYMRASTLTALSQLCYTHRVEPSSAGFDFCIEDFYGSAIVGIQPIILKDLMLTPEWDASIQDKVLRYYHMYRPIKPSINLPIAQVEYGIPIEQVNDFEPSKSEYWQSLLKIANTQWSLARSKEHLIDLLKAVASFENRKDVTDDDYIILCELLKPMLFEGIAITKEQLEGERYFDNNLIALLVEYYSYNGQFSIAHLAQDFKFVGELSLSQCYRIMQQQNGYWQQISKSPTIYKPSKSLERLLKQYQLEVRNES